MRKLNDNQIKTLARIARGHLLSKASVRSLVNRGAVVLDDPLDQGHQYLGSGSDWDRRGPRFYAWRIVCPDAQSAADAHNAKLAAIRAAAGDS